MKNEELATADFFFDISKVAVANSSIFILQSSF